jgi:hypothetical protein
MDDAATSAVGDDAEAIIVDLSPIDRDVGTRKFFRVLLGPVFSWGIPKSLFL